MSIAAIIAEYNPFHTGHAYQIEMTRKLTSCDHVIVLMSGDYVQRGQPALMDKYLRSQIALMEGADAVIEMPVYISTASAIDFAGGAVAILDHLGCVDYLSFGSEDGDLALLSEAAELFVTEPAAFRDLLKSHLSEGKSYPKARKLAYESFTGKDSEFLDKPNNILAISYLSALYKNKSKIKPVTIKRKGDYHALDLDLDFASASAIRQAFLANPDMTWPDEVAHYLGSQASIDHLQNLYKKEFPISMESFWPILKHELLLHEDFTGYYDVNEALSRRLARYSFSSVTYEDLCENLKTEGFTRSRINRCLLHILLNIKEEDVKLMKEAGFVSYIRVLGIRADKKKLLSTLSGSSDRPVVTSAKSEEKKSSPESYVFFRIQSELEKNASNLYESIKCYSLHNSAAIHEFSRKFLSV